MSGFVLNIVVSTNLSLFSAASFFAYGSDLVVAVVVINDIFDSQSDRGHFVGKSWYANLGVDGGVGISAVVFGTVSTVCGSMMVSKSHQGQESKDESLMR